jgi:hypothetical protein
LDEAIAEFDRALASAQALAHPPSIWTAAAELARARADAGRDDRAQEAAELARSTLGSFAAGLSETRRERFLASPYLEADVAVGR